MADDAARAVHLEPLGEPHYGERALGRFSIDCIILDEIVACAIVALRDGLNPFDTARCQSYAANLGLRYGVVANFGKDKLELKAVATN